MYEPYSAVVDVVLREAGDRHAGIDGELELSGGDAAGRVDQLARRVIGIGGIDVAAPQHHGRPFADRQCVV